jgi:GrpB-like predicted nucleotidyltransferase (UPF0157 family)
MELKLKDNKGEVLGLSRTVVRLSPYNEKWIEAYKTEEKLLRESMGDLIVDIQHVGSTSITGLISKPIIDIAVAIKTMSESKKCIELFTKLRYEYRENLKIPGLHFAKGGPDNRTHYIHVEELNDNTWYNYILFRDFLRVHPETLAEYAELKIQLAEKFADDRISYGHGKDMFITKIIETAKKELGIGSV